MLLYSQMLQMLNSLFSSKKTEAKWKICFDILIQKKKKPFELLYMSHYLGRIRVN